MRRQLLKGSSSYVEKACILSDKLPLRVPLYKGSDFIRMNNVPPFIKSLKASLNMDMRSDNAAKGFGYALALLTGAFMMKTFHENYMAEIDDGTRDFNEKLSWIDMVQPDLELKGSKLKSMWKDFFEKVDETVQWDNAIQSFISPCNIVSEAMADNDDAFPVLTLIQNYANANEVKNRLSKWNWNSFCSSAWAKVKMEEKKEGLTPTEHDNLLQRIWCPSDSSKIYLVSCKSSPLPLLKALHGKTKTAIVHCGSEKKVTFEALTRSLVKAIGISLPFALGFSRSNLTFNESGELSLSSVDIDWKTATFCVMNFFLKVIKFVNNADSSNPTNMSLDFMESRPDTLFPPSIVVNFCDHTAADQKNDIIDDPAESSQAMYVLYKFLAQLNNGKNNTNCVILVPPNSALKKMASFDDKIIPLVFEQE